MLKKVIEFPLFHVGTFTSQSGARVPFTEPMLRQTEKNTNFILRSKILQAPIGYDHPAAKSDAHGTLVGVRYENGVLYAQGDNWSDTLVADVKAMKKLAYSGELAENFTYPDGKGQVVNLGPAVVGMGILGSSRPAIKGLKPLSEFEFAEGTTPADAYLTREELRSAGLVSQHVDGTHFYAEVENDVRRFSERSNSEDDMDEKDFKRLLEENDKKWEDRFTKFEKQTEDRVKSFSEEGKRVEKISAFCETVNKEKPLGKLALDRLREALINPTEETVRAFAESLPAFIMPGGVAGKGKEGGEGDEDEEVQEPKALASLREKHFAEPSKYDSLLAQGADDLQKIRPKLFSEAKATTIAQRLAVTKQYVIEREAEAN